MHLDRFALIKARLLRNDLFAPPLVASSRKSYIALTPVEQLQRGAASGIGVHGSSPSSSGNNNSSVTVLGMLTQPEPGLWCIEDEGKAVPLDLSRCQRLGGYYTESAIVLVQGSYDPEGAPPSSSSSSPASSNSSSGSGSSWGAAGASAAAGGLHTHLIPGVLRVATLGHPPTEPRSASVRAMGIPDHLRAFSTPADLNRADAVMRGSADAANAMIAVLAHVHLDKQHVLDRLRRVLLGYRAVGAIPVAFILIGEFCSSAFGQHRGDRSAFQRHFDALASLLSEPEVAEVAACTQFILVPGPRDPGGGSGAVPRPAIPRSFAGRLCEPSVVPYVTLATNPCRLRFFSQEIVVYRGDVTSSLRRRAVVPPSDTPKPLPAHEHAARTVLAQCHLSPLPISVQPVYWAHDHALRLWPAPHSLIIAEEWEDQYDVTLKDDGSAVTSADLAADPSATYDISGGSRSGGGTLVFNPGVFADPSKRCFSTFFPAQARVEPSVAPDDDDDLLALEGGRGEAGDEEEAAAVAVAAAAAAAQEEEEAEAEEEGQGGNMQQEGDAEDGIVEEEEASVRVRPPPAMQRRRARFADDDDNDGDAADVTGGAANSGGVRVTVHPAADYDRQAVEPTHDGDAEDEAADGLQAEGEDGDADLSLGQVDQDDNTNNISDNDEGEEEGVRSSSSNPLVAAALRQNFRFIKPADEASSEDGGSPVLRSSSNINSSAGGGGGAARKRKSFAGFDTAVTLDGEDLQFDSDAVTAANGDGDDDAMGSAGAGGGSSSSSSSSGGNNGSSKRRDSLGGDDASGSDADDDDGADDVDPWTQGNIDEKDLRTADEEDSRAPSIAELQSQRSASNQGAGSQGPTSFTAGFSAAQRTADDDGDEASASASAAASGLPPPPPPPPRMSEAELDRLLGQVGE